MWIDTIGLILIACGVIATNLLRSRMVNLTTHGSAGWGIPPIRFRRALELGGLQIGYHRGNRVVLSREATLQHGVIIGGTGTGKSRCYFLPNASALAGTSLVCTDPKGELWRHTSGFHRLAFRFAPAEPESSVCFNFIPLCRDARIAELCSRAIVESGNTGATDQAWLDLEAAYLSALFSHAATLAAPTPMTAYRLCTGQTQETLIEQLLDSESPTARDQANVFLQTQERMRGSIVPVVAARLQFLRDDSVARFTSASLAAPDFGRLRKEPAAVYWCLKEQDITRLRPLTAVFFSLLLDQISGTSDAEADVPITLLLDEFANIGNLQSFETTIAVVRGRGVAIWLGIQSLSQLEARYGRANAQTILTNCGTKIALHGLDVETARYLSASLGEGTVTAARASNQRLFGVLPSPIITVSDQHHARPLLTPDEVRRIRTDEAIVISGNVRPMHLKKRYYSAPPNKNPNELPTLGIALESLPPAARGAMPPALPDELRLPLLQSS